MSQEVRLVRCPKCDKVLPEPPGIPVYQCGGCGAILRAKKKPLVSDKLVEKSGEENSSSCDTAIHDNKHKLDMNGKSPARSMEGDLYGAKSPARSMEGDLYGVKSPLRENGLTEFHGGLPKSPMRDRFLNDLGKTSVPLSDTSRSPKRETGDSDEFDFDGLKPRGRSRNVSKSPARSVRTIGVSRSPLREGVGFDGAGKSPSKSIDKDVVKSTVFKIAPKASFNDWISNDNHEESSLNSDIEEQKRESSDRAEDRADKISEGVGSVVSDERGTMSEGSEGQYKNGRFRNENFGPSHNYPGSMNSYGSPRQSFESMKGPASVHELQQQRKELLRKYKELKDQLSEFDDVELSSPGFYNKPDGFSVDETFRHRCRSPLLQYPPDRDMYDTSSLNDYQLPNRIREGAHSNHYLPKHIMPGYGPGRSVDFDHDRFETHGHHPACDCLRCYSNDRQRHHSSIAQKGHEYLETRSNFSYGTDIERYGGPRVYDPRMSHTNPRRRSPYLAHHHRHSKSLSIARLCRPISGGAPFVICDKCFKLLKLPGNSIAKQKNPRLRCGACSTVISFDLQHKSSDFVPSLKKSDSFNVVTGDTSEDIKDSGSKHDFEAGGNKFHSTGSVTSRVSNGLSKGSTSSPLRVSVDKYMCDTTSDQPSHVNSSKMPIKMRPPPGSSLKEHLDYSTNFSLKVTENNFPGSSLNVCPPTETEFPRNELPKSVSQDSEDIMAMLGGGDYKGTRSPIQALLNPLTRFNNKSGRQGSPGKAEVYVNGQALSQRAVKKAEKLAGTIQPGEYWYDPKAGFWGVMGGRCLGIIPPSIPEFSNPMPEDCSKGDSRIYVNGRELQKWDLDLLAQRDLPTIRNKRYVVDISGKVLDENTRDFIVNLGRLAPSVEKHKHGFGMQFPEQLDV